LTKVAVLYSGHVGGKTKETHIREGATEHPDIWHLCRTNQEVVLGDVDRYFYTYTEPQNTIYKQFSQIYEQYYHKFHPAVVLCDSYRHNCAYPINVLNNWHNGFVGFSLVPNTYDIYIKSRCDIALMPHTPSTKWYDITAYQEMINNLALDTLNLNKYAIKPNVIYVPRGFDWGELNDQFAIGTYETMRKYFEVYLSWQALLNNGFAFHPETFLNIHLQRQGVKIVILDFSTYIIRSE
jgi:hypothetical protein